MQSTIAGFDSPSCPTCNGPASYTTSAPKPIDICNDVDMASEVGSLNHSFDPTAFLEHLGRRLVLEFQSASLATTPGLVGDSREGPARTAFEALLPGDARVATGVVIDADGRSSKQQDIVVYEGGISPVYAVNNVPSSTFFPVEGVCAIGEVKSSLGQAELEDAFAKIASVKGLTRYSVPEPSLGTMIAPFRSYGSRLSAAGAKDEEFDQLGKHTDQVFGFILCNSFSLKVTTMLERAEALWSGSERHLSPNIIVSMTDGFLIPSSPAAMLMSPLGASHIAFDDRALEGFAELVRMLNLAYSRGRTVPTSAFARYLASAGAGPREVLMRPLK